MCHSHGTKQPMEHTALTRATSVSDNDWLTRPVSPRELLHSQELGLSVLEMRKQFLRWMMEGCHEEQVFIRPSGQCRWPERTRR
jgi:hypothetical protein